MPALSIDDELNDDLSALKPLIRSAARGDLTPAQADALLIRYDAIERKAASNAAFKRLARAFDRRGDTRHTRELARSLLRIEPAEPIAS